MNRDQRVLVELPIKSGGGGATHVRVSIDYRLGGHNYFTGEMQTRGLYLDVTPLEIGENFTGYQAFSGTCMHVHEMKRFNAKTLREYKPKKESFERLFNYVMKCNNTIVLEDEPNWEELCQ